MSDHVEDYKLSDQSCVYSWDSTHGIHSTLFDDKQTLIPSSNLQHLLQQLLLLLLLLLPPPPLLLLLWLQGEYSKELASTLLPDCHDKCDK
jgi:hypothetical protein